ncbi:MAG: hypothetical protein ACKO5K_15995 [Armatimonadota bacterium]
MERWLFLIAALVALAAWIAGGGVRRRGSAEPAGFPFWLPALPGVVGLLACLPATEPFNEGLGLGWGLLAGGIAAMAALRVADAGPADGAARTAPAVVAVVVAFVLLREGLVDALTGVALGWVSGFVAAELCAPGRVAGAVPALVGGTAALAAAVGVFRNDGDAVVPKDAWSIAPVLAVAAVGAVQGFAGRVGGARAPLVGRVAGTLAWLAVLLLAWKRVGAGWMFPAIGLGATGVWFLCAAIVGRGDSRVRRVLAGMVLLSGEVVAADLLANFGTGLFALGLGMGALLVSPGRGMAGMLGLPIGLMVLRLHGVVFSSELSRFGLADQTNLAAFLIGGGCAVWAEESARAEVRRWLAVVLPGAILLAIPAAVVLLMGAPAESAVLLGLAAVGGGFAAVRHADRASLCAVAAAIGVFATAHSVHSVLEEYRKDRIRQTLIVSAPVIVLAAFAEATRRKARKGRS